MIDWKGALFYLAVISFSTLLVYLYKIFTLKKTLFIQKVGGYSALVTSFLSLFLVSALRLNVGTDYSSYERIYRRMENGWASYYEYGFRYLSKLLIALGLNVQWLLAISAFITLLCVYIVAIRFSRNSALTIFLFSTMAFYFSSMNGVRQYIAIGISLMGFWLFVYLKNKYKIILPTFLAIMAVQFHRTSLIMIPIYLFVVRRFNTVTYAVLFVLFSTLILFRGQMTDIMLKIYPSFVNKPQYLNVISFSEILTLTAVLSLLSIIWMLKKGYMSLENIIDRVVLNLVYVSFVMHTVLIWVPLIQRLSIYVDIGYIVIIPYIISKIETRKYRIVAITLIAIAYLIYLWTSIVLHGSYDVLPYQTLLMR